MPENTIPAFTKAVELGCDWLEMDVVITADSQVLVSHEPWMNHLICRSPQGDSITESTEHDFNIHRMSLAEAQRFDCGSATHPDFPDQENRALSKPLLHDVVAAADEKSMELGAGGISYNIEIKSEPTLYGTYQPEPKRFVQLVLSQIDSLGLEDRCVIQSFDPAILEEVHLQHPDLSTSLLVENDDDLATNLKRLSFKPDHYSPAFSMVDKKLVKELEDRDIALLVWTVNDKDDMRRMIKLGVTGIITDYPDRLIAVLDEEE
jgi:glycerophosphoryl diester phosphodiesterase